MSLVERRTDQVVHRPVDDHKVFAVVRLVVENLVEQHAGISHDEPPGLENAA